MENDYIVPDYNKAKKTKQTKYSKLKLKKFKYEPW